MNAKLTPYLSFENCCEEALQFYQEVLGGSFSIVQRYDNSAFKVPEHLHNKVLHAMATFAGNDFFASDGMTLKNETAVRNIGLSLQFDSPETGQEVFDRLSAGGTVHVPFTKQFWGAWHGNFTDKFGIRWMVNCD